MKAILLGCGCLYLLSMFSRRLLTLGLLLHIVYLGIRGYSAGRLPLLGPHDTLAFFSCCLAAVLVAASGARQLRGEATYSAIGGGSAALFTFLAAVFPAFDMPLPPILDTLWFEGHVVLAFMAYGAFGGAAAVAAVSLAKRETPTLDLQYRLNLTGYTLFSLSMIMGGIWGYYAWGTYWLWTAKELWTSILWVYYSFWLHLKYHAIGRDRIPSWGSIAGFAITLFTYLGVSMLMRSSHSF